jgi:polysaccharide export outer membrane protein
MMRTLDMNSFIKLLMALWVFILIFNVLSADNLSISKPAYRLKYGDKFTLSVYGEPGTSLDGTVGPDGKIHYLFSISVPAIGKTISEVRQDLTKDLQKYFKHPLLNIIPTAFTPELYTIIGEIMNPGVKPLIANSTLLTALCESGGFTTRLFRNQTVDQVDLDRSFLARKGRYVQIDFYELLNQGDLTWDMPLENGDYLYFASAGINKVFVLGEVRQSTVVEYLDGITLIQAIAEAGGVTIKASSRILVIRGSLAYPRWFYIDSNLIFKGKSCDFELQPKDIVYVPPMQFQTLKDIVQEGITSFVSITANIAGSNSFLEITPAAKTANVVSPVPVVGGVVATPPAATSAP